MGEPNRIRMSEPNRILLKKTADNLRGLVEPCTVKLLENGIQVSYQGRKLMFYYRKCVVHDNQADCKENQYKRFQRGKEADIVKATFAVFKVPAYDLPKQKTVITNVDGVTACIEHVKKKLDILLKLDVTGKGRPADTAKINLLNLLIIEFEQYRIPDL